MERIVKLDDRVTEAIRKTGGTFDSVTIDTSRISTIGVSHVKIRHLNDFLEYSIYKKKGDAEKRKEIEDELLVEEYAAAKGLNPTEHSELLSYFNDFTGLNEIRATLEGKCNCKPKIDQYLGTADIDERDQAFKELCKRGENIPGYLDHCKILKNIYEHMLGRERKNKQLFKRIYEDIEGNIEDIVKNPATVYWHKMRKDFTFCSNVYGTIYVLTLKIGESGNAYVFTGQKIKASKLNNVEYKKVYQKPHE